MDDDALNARIADRRLFHFGGEAAAIDRAGFDAEQDAIAAIRQRVEAGYARVNGGGIAPRPLAQDAADRLCPVCYGAGIRNVDNVWRNCPDCYGSGIEGPYLIAGE